MPDAYPNILEINVRHFIIAIICDFEYARIHQVPFEQTFLKKFFDIVKSTTGAFPITNGRITAFVSMVKEWGKIKKYNPSRIGGHSLIQMTQYFINELMTDMYFENLAKDVIEAGPDIFIDVNFRDFVTNVQRISRIIERQSLEWFDNDVTEKLNHGVCPI